MLHKITVFNINTNYTFIVSFVDVLFKKRLYPHLPSQSNYRAALCWYINCGV